MQFNNKISLITYLIANGISIPHYCYHNDLSIAGNCRVCIVELKNSLKPIVSCATSVNSTLFNNDIYHDSVLIKKARENILEKITKTKSKYANIMSKTPIAIIAERQGINTKFVTKNNPGN